MTDTYHGFLKRDRPDFSGVRLLFPLKDYSIKKANPERIALVEPFTVPDGYDIVGYSEPVLFACSLAGFPAPTNFIGSGPIEWDEGKLFFHASANGKAEVEQFDSVFPDYIKSWLIATLTTSHAGDMIFRQAVVEALNWFGPEQREGEDLYFTQAVDRLFTDARPQMEEVPLTVNREAWAVINHYNWVPQI